MRAFHTTTTLGLTLLVAMGLAGCDGAATSTGPETSSPPTAEGHDPTGHAHASEGPHGGELIELGDEEYHAELLHDEQAGTVTVYVLDGAAAQPTPIEASEITINAKHDGTPEQFTLAASPDEGDPAGQSSRFVSEDKNLAAHLDDEGADAKLVLTINGKSYRGEIAHDHDDHEHADE